MVHMGFLVEPQAYAMPAVVPHDGVSVLDRMLLDCVTDLANIMAGQHVIDPDIQALFRHPYQF